MPQQVIDDIGDLPTRALPLREQRLGTTSFYLSLPPGFALQATDAAGFRVY